VRCLFFNHQASKKDKKKSKNGAVANSHDDDESDTDTESMRGDVDNAPRSSAAASALPYAPEAAAAALFIPDVSASLSVASAGADRFKKSPSFARKVEPTTTVSSRDSYDEPTPPMQRPSELAPPPTATASGADRFKKLPTPGAGAGGGGGGGGGDVGERQSSVRSMGGRKASDPLPVPPPEDDPLPDDPILSPDPAPPLKSPPSTVATAAPSSGRRGTLPTPVNPPPSTSASMRRTEAPPIPPPDEDDGDDNDDRDRGGGGAGGEPPSNLQRSNSITSLQSVAAADVVSADVVEGQVCLDISTSDRFSAKPTITIKVIGAQHLVMKEP
jgi:hypothetical protein